MSMSWRRAPNSSTKVPADPCPTGCPRTAASGTPAVHRSRCLRRIRRCGGRCRGTRRLRRCVESTPPRLGGARRRGRGPACAECVKVVTTGLQAGRVVPIVRAMLARAGAACVVLGAALGAPFPSRLTRRARADFKPTREPAGRRHTPCGRTCCCPRPACTGSSISTDSAHPSNCCGARGSTSRAAVGSGYTRSRGLFRASGCQPAPGGRGAAKGSSDGQLPDGRRDVESGNRP